MSRRTGPRPLLLVTATWMALLAFGGPAWLWWGLCAVLGVMCVRRLAHRATLAPPRDDRPLPYDAAARFGELHARRLAAELNPPDDSMRVIPRGCAHDGAVAVRTRDWDPEAAGDVVAWWCDACKTQLPATWSPPSGRYRNIEAGAAYAAVRFGGLNTAALGGAIERWRAMLSGEPMVIDGNLDVRPAPAAAVWESPVDDSREAIEAAGYEAVCVPSIGDAPGCEHHAHVAGGRRPSVPIDPRLTGQGPFGWVRDDELGCWVLEDAAGEPRGAVSDSMLASATPWAELAEACRERYGSCPPPLRDLDA